jgi:uncharacterized protein YecE (DUF72 family)
MTKRWLPQIRVGTSGWSYQSWRGPFFPREVMVKHHLAYYASQFDTAELNGVFYRTPSLETVRTWHDTTPDGFLFAWKASQFITHWKRLGPTSRNSLDLINERLRILGRKTGPVLFQLPPRFVRDDNRLKRFLPMLSKRWRYAFEFRHPSWYDETVYELLRRHNAALCISDHHDAPAPWITTADFVYIRGHGPGGAYKGSYSDSTLRSWSQSAVAWCKAGRPVFIYFDNDQKSAAPLDGLRLLKITDASAAMSGR